MIDGGLRQIFHNRLKKFGAHCQAIETGTGRGVPDSNICLDGVESWLEFKKTSAYSVRLSPEQIGWHLTRCRAGGKVFIAVRKKRNSSKRLNAVDELWIVEGLGSAELKEHGLKTSTHVLGVWDGGPRAWDWDAIRSILTAK